MESRALLANTGALTLNEHDMAVGKLMGLVLCMSVIGCVSTAGPTADGSPGMPRPSTAGICYVGVWVEMSGEVREANLLKSTGVPSIDAACLNAVRGQDFGTQLIIDPVLFNPGTLRRYTVVELHWRQKNPAR